MTLFLNQNEHDNLDTPVCPDTLVCQDPPVCQETPVCQENYSQRLIT